MLLYCVRMYVVCCMCFADYDYASAYLDSRASTAARKKASVSAVSLTEYVLYSGGGVPGVGGVG